MGFHVSLGECTSTVGSPVGATCSTEDPGKPSRMEIHHGLHGRV